MWTYEKKLQYPVNIKTPNPRLAKFIISQLGGPDGELAASLRYMHQRYGMKNNQVKGILTDIATEELAHVEMVSAILYQLTRDMTPEQILQDGFWYAVYGCLFPVEGRPDYRPDGRPCSGTKGTQHL